MKRLIPLLLLSGPLLAKTIETDELKERQAIDRLKPTLILFPEAAHLALPSALVDLESMSEGDGSKVWKVTPRCKKDCSLEQVDLEFVLLSGKQLLFKLEIKEGVADHILTLQEVPSQGSVHGARHGLLPQARDTFLRTIRNWPPLPKAEGVKDDSFRQLAEKWEHFQTDAFLVHVGKNTHAKKRDIETLNDPALVLAGFYDDALVLIRRRAP